MNEQNSHGPDPLRGAVYACFLLQFRLKILWTISGLSQVQLDKHGITILCHQYQSRPCTFALKLISMDKSRSSSTEIRILN